MQFRKYAAERGIPALLILMWMMGMILHDFWYGLRTLPPGRDDRRFLLHGGFAIVLAALIKMGSRAVPRLVDALHHTHSRVRLMAARILARNGPRPEIVSALMPLLADRDLEVRNEVRSLLVELVP